MGGVGAVAGQVGVGVGRGVVVEEFAEEDGCWRGRTGGDGGLGWFGWCGVVGVVGWWGDEVGLRAVVVDRQRDAVHFVVVGFFEDVGQRGGEVREVLVHGCYRLRGHLAHSSMGLGRESRCLNWESFERSGDGA